MQRKPKGLVCLHMYFIGKESESFADYYFDSNHGFSPYRAQGRGDGKLKIETFFLPEADSSKNGWPISVGCQLEYVSPTKVNVILCKLSNWQLSTDPASLKPTVPDNTPIIDHRSK